MIAISKSLTSKSFDAAKSGSVSHRVWITGNGSALSYALEWPMRDASDLPIQFGRKALA